MPQYIRVLRYAPVQLETGLGKHDQIGELPGLDRASVSFKTPGNARPNIGLEGYSRLTVPGDEPAGGSSRVGFAGSRRLHPGMD